MQKLLQQWQAEDKLTALCGAISSPLQKKTKIWQLRWITRLTKLMQKPFHWLQSTYLMNALETRKYIENYSCKQLETYKFLHFFQLLWIAFVFVVLTRNNTVTFANNHAKFQSKNTFTQSSLPPSPLSNDELDNPSLISLHGASVLPLHWETTGFNLSETLYFPSVCALFNKQ